MAKSPHRLGRVKKSQPVNDTCRASCPMECISCALNSRWGTAMKTKKTDWGKLAARLNVGATPDVPDPNWAPSYKPPKNPPTETPKRKRRFKVKKKRASDRGPEKGGPSVGSRMVWVGSRSAVPPYPNLAPERRIGSWPVRGGWYHRLVPALMASS